MNSLKLWELAASYCSYVSELSFRARHALREPFWSLLTVSGV